MWKSLVPTDNRLRQLGELFESVKREIKSAFFANKKCLMKWNRVISCEPDRCDRGWHDSKLLSKNKIYNINYYNKKRIKRGLEKVCSRVQNPPIQNPNKRPIFILKYEKPELQLCTFWTLWSIRCFVFLYTFSD